MSECCGVTGPFGLTLIILALIVSFLMGVGCIVCAIWIFISKRDSVTWGEGQRWSYLVGLCIAGVLILLAFIVACVFAANRIAGMVGFAIIFCIELALLVWFAVFLYLSYKEGDYWTLDLAAVLILPIGMAFCVIAILLLLIEGYYIGTSALDTFIIVALVLCFIFFLLIVAVIAWLIYNNMEEGATRTWIVVGILLVAAVLQIAGVITTCFFTLSLTAGAVGFIICALVAGIIMTVYAIFFFIARDTEDKAYKWTVFTVACVCAFFCAVALIGLLAMGGLWVTNSSGKL
jgi:heme/copper-type cytochrome/quinol oxidase subunit 4